MRAGQMIGAIEGGGTKVLVAVGHGPTDVHRSARFETRSPDQTLPEVIDFLKRHHVAAVGVAMFGPVELRAGPAMGTMLATPKPGWEGTPVRRRLADALGVPVAIDTDVNAAALAEARYGAGRGVDPVVYITVGTGIGGGLVVHGRPVHGLLHPEVGHIRVPRQADDTFDGICPFHGACLEGLASGPAIAARSGQDPSRLPDDHPVWERCARYLGAGLATLVLAVSPGRLILGGGVMERPLLAPIRAELSRQLGGYLKRPELGEELSRYVVAPALDAPGLAGAFVLAGEALVTSRDSG